MALFQDKRRLIGLLLAFILLIVAIYVLLPKVVGLDDTLERIDEAKIPWVVVALGFTVASYAAYTALFRGVVGGYNNDDFQRRLDLRATYQINMASLAASRIFSAGGAGGIAVSYWALRKAGMERRRAACRMVAFLTMLYGIYLLALIVFGILLRVEVLPGEDPWGGTIVPAGLAGIALVIVLAFALIPEDAERRLMSIGTRFERLRDFAAKLRRGRRPWPAACAPRSPTCAVRAAARSRWRAQSASGPRRSA